MLLLLLLLLLLIVHVPYLDRIIRAKLSMFVSELKTHAHISSEHNPN